MQTDEFIERTLRQLVKITAGVSERVFFLHIPKTGGSSITEFLRETIGLPVLHIGAAKPSISWPLQRGHVPLSYAEKGFSTITAIREPFARLVSQHQFLASENLRMWMNTAAWGAGRPPAHEVFVDLVDYSFGEQIERIHETSRAGSFSWQFSLNTYGVRDFGELTTAKKLREIASAINHMTAIVSVDKPETLQNLGDFLGVSDPHFPTENVTIDSPKGAGVSLNASQWKALFEILAWDNQVIVEAERKFPNLALPTGKRRALIDKGLKRLGLKLPTSVSMSDFFAPREYRP